MFPLAALSSSVSDADDSSSPGVSLYFDCPPGKRASDSTRSGSTNLKSVPCRVTNVFGGLIRYLELGERTMFSTWQSRAARIPCWTPKGPCAAKFRCRTLPRLINWMASGGIRRSNGSRALKQLSSPRSMRVAFVDDASAHAHAHAHEHAHAHAQIHTYTQTHTQIHTQIHTHKHAHSVFPCIHENVASCTHGCA